MEQEKNKFRHEFKYLISDAQLQILKTRTRGILQLDRNASDQGHYTIRSLYFDDLQNTCFYENENGTDPREKFRIRIYNGDTDRIRLECKRKERGMTQKTSCPLSREQTELLMQGKPLRNNQPLPALAKKLNEKILSNGMRPVVIVEYDRIPYVYRDGNVRATLDMNISSCRDISSFLEPEILRRPIMPLGHQLLEVKFDAFLPDHIYRSLQLQNLQRIAFSKYYLCRKYK